MGNRPAPRLELFGHENASRVPFWCATTAAQRPEIKLVAATPFVNRTLENR